MHKISEQRLDEYDCLRMLEVYGCVTETKSLKGD